jgi:hypothetical protein
MTEAKDEAVAVDAAALQPPVVRDAAVTRCACGHDRSHPQVAPEPVYTEWSWLLFLIGVTAKPRSVLYRCIWCKQVLASTRDPKVRAKLD